MTIPPIRQKNAMGLFTVGCKVENPAASSKTAIIPRILVDTGSEFTWIDEAILRKIGIEPRKKDLQIQLANGEIVTRSVGFAILHVDKSLTTDEVVFAQTGDLLLLGARALEGLNLQVDTRQKRLVAAGPIIAATAIRPELWRNKVPRAGDSTSRSILKKLRKKGARRARTQRVRGG